MYSIFDSTRIVGICITVWCYDVFWDELGVHTSCSSPCSTPDTWFRRYELCGAGAMNLGAWTLSHTPHTQMSSLRPSLASELCPLLLYVPVGCSNLQKWDEIQNVHPHHILIRLIFKKLLFWCKSNIQLTKTYFCSQTLFLPIPRNSWIDQYSSIWLYNLMFYHFN